jgi:hypothetical protein
MLSATNVIQILHVYSIAQDTLRQSVGIPWQLLHAADIRPISLG